VYQGSEVTVAVMEVTENVDKFLQEIEKKYSLNSDILPKNDFEEQLHILSQEFDTFGLPPIDLKESVPKLLQCVANNTLLLIHLHRKALLQITDTNISNVSKDTKNSNLEKNILSLKSKLKIVEDQNLKQERKLAKLNDECTKLHKTVSLHKIEMEKLKQYFKSKQNELTHHISNLKNENHHLREMCGKDIGKYFSKEDKYLKILQNYKHNEDVYKNTLEKLEENNIEIMNEILNLKKELALAYLKK
jgi:chromosome segregation ATPase